MNGLGILGLALGIALLLLAIPQIDVARAGIAAVVSSPIGTLVGILTLVMVVCGIVIAMVNGLGGR